MKRVTATLETPRGVFSASETIDPIIYKDFPISAVYRFYDLVRRDLVDNVLRQARDADVGEIERDEVYVTTLEEE